MQTLKDKIDTAASKSKGAAEKAGKAVRGTASKAASKLKSAGKRVGKRLGA